MYTISHVHSTQSSVWLTGEREKGGNRGGRGNAVSAVITSSLKCWLHTVINQCSNQDWILRLSMKFTFEYLKIFCSLPKLMLLEEAESLLFWSWGESIFRHDTHTVAKKAGWKGKTHLVRERERESSNPDFELWITDCGDLNMAQIFLFLAPCAEEHPQSVDVRPDGGWLKGMFHTSSAFLFPWPVCLEYYSHFNINVYRDWD